MWEVLLNPLGSKVVLGSLRCFDMPWHLCFFQLLINILMVKVSLNSISHKQGYHNMWATCMYMFVILRKSYGFGNDTRVSKCWQKFNFCMNYLWIVHHWIRRPRHVLWLAQWLKFLKNRLMEWDTEDSKCFHAVQYVGKAGPLVWCRYIVVWSDNTLKWDGCILNAKPNSTDSEKNEDWRNGCLTVPRVPHLCLGKGVRGRKRAVYLLRCVPVLGNCATTILKTGCWASWTTCTRGWCFSQISGAPPPYYNFFLNSKCKSCLEKWVSASWQY